MCIVYIYIYIYIKHTIIGNPMTNQFMCVEMSWSFSTSFVVVCHLNFDTQ